MVASGCLAILFALLFSFDPRVFSSQPEPGQAPPHSKEVSSLLQVEPENEGCAANRGDAAAKEPKTTIDTSRSRPLSSPLQGQGRPTPPSLYRKTDEEVLEQILWALGNIAGDSSHFRDLLLSPQAFLQHLQQIQPHFAALQTQPHFSLIHHYVDILDTLHKTRRSLLERSPHRLLLATTTGLMKTTHRYHPGGIGDGNLAFPSLQDQLLVLLPYCRNAQTWKTGIWFLSNLCRGHPKPQVRPSLGREGRRGEETTFSLYLLSALPSSRSTSK